MTICAEMIVPVSRPSTPALLRLHGGHAGCSTRNVQPTFQQLVRHAGLKPRSAACRPRLHDFGMALPSIPSLTAIAMAATRAPGLRSCRPISATSTLAIHTGISRPRRSCWSWPVTGWSVTSEVTHDRTCHDLAGVLHGSPGPSAPGQPAYARCIPGHPAAAAGLRIGQERQ